jgi:hypothetical protein
VGPRGGTTRRDAAGAGREGGGDHGDQVAQALDVDLEDLEDLEDLGDLGLMPG